MKKLIAYIFILFFSFWWATGCSPKLDKILVQRGIVLDDYRYGDLYRFSNLAQFKSLIEPCPVHPPIQSKPISLHIAGDSFTEDGRIKKSDFTVTEMSRSHIADTSYLFIDTNKVNVLIIETVERHFRERFLNQWSNLKINEMPKEKKVEEKKFSLKDFEIPYNEELHYSMIFSSDFFLRIKEKKAKFFQKYFDKIDPNVKITKDNKNIVYAIAFDSSPTSIFYPLYDAEIDSIVVNMNRTADAYKKLGFKEVYFSIIPNKATAVGQHDGPYNHLIERVQQNPLLTANVIDMYKPLSLGKDRFYYLGDTHWNCQGKQIWTNKVNFLLGQIE